MLLFNNLMRNNFVFPLFKLTMIGIIIGLVSFSFFILVGYHPLKLFLDFFYPNLGQGDGLAALVFVAAVYKLYEVLWGIITAIITAFIFKNWKYFLIVIVIFIICMFIKDKIDTQKSQQQYEQQFGAKDREIQRVSSEAKQTEIEILDFQEEGELDANGYLTKLTLKMKINSNKKVIIYSPYFLQIKGIDSQTGIPMCFILTKDNTPQSKKYEITKGINIIEDQIEQFIFNNQQFIASDEGNLIVSPNFTIYTDNDQVFGEAIEKISNLSSKNINFDCDYNSSKIQFKTKPYKLKLK